MRKLATVAVLAAALGCVSSGKYQKKAQQAVELDTKVQQQAARIAELEKQNAELAQKESELQVKTAALSQEKGKLEAKSAEYERLARSLQGEIDKGQVELSELQGKMIVKLKDRILFPSGSARLSKDGRKALDGVAGALSGIVGKNIVVAGYTDDVRVGKGSGFADNWDLSTARAVAVVRYLASKGVDPQALGAAGFSQYRPVAGNDSREGRSLNRRIEIGLTAADYTPREVDVGTK